MKYLLITLQPQLSIVLPLPGHAADIGAFRMGYLEGDVQINSDEMQAWMPASINMPQACRPDMGAR